MYKNGSLQIQIRAEPDMGATLLEVVATLHGSCDQEQEDPDDEYCKFCKRLAKKKKRQDEQVIVWS